MFLLCAYCNLSYDPAVLTVLMQLPDVNRCGQYQICPNATVCLTCQLATQTGQKKPPRSYSYRVPTASPLKAILHW